VIVTPEPCVIVVCPAPVWAKFKTVPTGNATLELGGIVNVLADALERVTSALLPSARTAVYEAVCALIVSVGVTLVLVNKETAIS
jgi:hypothetical protein